MIRLLLTILLLVPSMLCQAATVDITAEFQPSLSKPEANEFINTTKQSGYCTDFPPMCPPGSGKLSISLPYSVNIAVDELKANATGRNAAYFKMPGAWRKVSVTNGEQKTQSVEFRFSSYSGRLRNRNDWNHDNRWVGKSFLYAPTPCGISNLASGNSQVFTFMWVWPQADAACIKIPTMDSAGDPYLIELNSFGYELRTPDPLRMESGIYKGSIALTIGPGGDIDYGDSFRATDTELVLNFTLSVNHELKLTPVDNNVSLQPCGTERVCTEEQGRANWERWMITNVTPSLTGRSRFNLSSSGAFSVSLQCGQQAGSDCALESEGHHGVRVPVRTFLTLPPNVVDMSTGATVTKRRLEVGTVTNQNRFVTKTFGHDKTGSIDFLVEKKNVDTMLKNTPDTYKGAVTVVFDPKIY